MNPSNPIFIWVVQKISEAPLFDAFLLCFTYIGRLHSAASAAVFAFKTHRIGEDYVVEVQGTVGLGKIVYLGCVLDRWNA